MYTVVRLSEPLKRSSDFSMIVRYCVNNRCVKPGLKGSANLARGVNIWRESCGCNTLIKSWLDRPSGS